jgi:hypothetical protein
VGYQSWEPDGTTRLYGGSNSVGDWVYYVWGRT